MNMTREEAIRNFREHWASNAITGVDWTNKHEYLERHNYSNVKNDCFLCEFAQGNCNICPIEWPETGRFGCGSAPCVLSHYGNWHTTKTPEERKRLAALIRDLPEKQKKKEPAPDFKVGDWVKVLEPGYYFPNGHSLLDGKMPDLPQERPVEGKPYEVIAVSEKQNSSYGFIYGLRSKDNTICQIRHTSSHQKRGLELTTAPPKYQVGDKVVPVSKSIGCFTGKLDSEPCWRDSKEQGYFYVTQSFQEDGRQAYSCHNKDIRCGGNHYLESDLIPYVEPEVKKEPEKKDRPFQVGDRVRSIEDIGKGNIGTIKSLHPVSCIDCVVEFDVSCTGLNMSGYKPGYACVKNFVNLELLPLNHAPENKTITAFCATFIFNGPVTVCIIDVDGRIFKGIAKCAPEDTWDESIGKGWAGLRAMQKMLKATEKNLKKAKN